MSVRDKATIVLLVFFCMNATIFTLAFLFSEDFRASGATFAGIVLGNIVAALTGMAGFGFAAKESSKAEDEEDKS